MIWTQGFVKIAPDAVQQVLKQREDGSIRCLVAGKPFRRGERIARIPAGSVLSGSRAYQLLHQFYHGSKKENSRWDMFLNQLTQIDVPHTLSSSVVCRDSLLMTSAIFLLRRESETISNVFSSYHFISGRSFKPLMRWVQSWPRKVPPLTAVLEAANRERLSCTTGNECYRNGSRKRQSTSEWIKVAEHKDTLRHALDFGIHSVACQESEENTIPTREMKVNFFNQRRNPLNAHQMNHQFRHPLSFLSHVTWRYLMRLEDEVDHVLRQLLDAIHALEGLESQLTEENYTTAFETLRWAHFMLRSRGVNCCMDSGSLRKDFVVVPLVDMINHDFEKYNVTYVYGKEEESINLIAIRDISTNDELTLHYGCEWQREIFRTNIDESFRSNEIQRNYSTHNSSISVPEISRETLSREEYDGVAPRHTPRRFLCFIESDGKEDLCSLREILHRRGRSTEAKRKAALYLSEAYEEAEWLWRFGFIKGSKEILHEASLKWSSALMNRIAHLTDVRRHGREGEFVIGVPEGLRHLREQRMRLERERYFNKTVFPPQRT